MLSVPADSDTPVTKTNVENLIRAGGGLVYDTLPTGDTDNVVLLSDSPSTCEKYIEALLRGIVFSRDFLAPSLILHR